MIAESGNDFDAHVDDELLSYVDLERPKSFLLFAGAGSGKTRSLVTLLERIVASQGRRLWLKGQRVRVVTFTNTACDEINRRLRFNPMVEVSTIHSFCWSMIENFNSDIKEWLKVDLAGDIAELQQQELNGRPGTKASHTRKLSIASKERRLARLDEVRRFTYSPTGDNRGRDSLNHGEVLSITASFLQTAPTLAQILVTQFPIFLIDESQDTNQKLIDALLSVQAANADSFCLGLFGDMMQRIYADGKAGLDDILPPDWAKPRKAMNHRCTPRVVSLINKIRQSADTQQQKARDDKPSGTARLFILSNAVADKQAAESVVAARMAAITGDMKWKDVTAGFKTLTLEHHMAARRAGFLEMFEALYTAERFRTGLLDGSLPRLRVFIKDVLPLLQAHRAGDEFAKAAVVRQSSPLLSASVLIEAGEQQERQLDLAREAASKLMALWDGPSSDPTFQEVLACVGETGLFELSEIVRSKVITRKDAAEPAEGSPEDEAADPQEETDKAWELFLGTRFEQIIAYTDYVSGSATSATHQGVKGLEFPRVLVVIDDQEARGFMFSYDKLFQSKAKSASDLANERDGNETSIDRTRRLFYVTCSRAEQSLAIVAYSENPTTVRATAIREGWFDDDEIELLTM
jgi:DNA helicase-2/ATP-dependent DNA helicase PcrA